VAVEEAVGEGVSVAARGVEDGCTVEVAVLVVVEEGDGTNVATAAREAVGVRLVEAAIARPGLEGPFPLDEPAMALVIRSRHSSITIAPATTAASIASLRPLS
jgi:hypothetical protein